MTYYVIHEYKYIIAIVSLLFEVKLREHMFLFYQCALLYFVIIKTKICVTKELK